MGIDGKLTLITFDVSTLHVLVRTLSNHLTGVNVNVIVNRS